MYIDFNCRIAARIQDLARMDLANAGVRHTILGGLEQLSSREANQLLAFSRTIDWGN